jgi:hypothetical protein
LHKQEGAEAIRLSASLFGTFRFVLLERCPDLSSSSAAKIPQKVPADRCAQFLPAGFSSDDEAGEVNTGRIYKTDEEV